MNRHVLLCGAATVAVIAAAHPARAAEAGCASLTATALDKARIDSAEIVPAGQFTPPPGNGGNPRPFDVPAFCRVRATLSPSADSEIHSEVWMPTAGWNGKFMMVGNGAWGGVVNYAAIAVGLRRGYAVAATDTGHTTQGGGFAVGHPEKWTDYGWRAVHETAVKAKTITRAFYGAPPRLSYWNGCSTGGKQALKAVQAFPEDFDGVIAGAPANNWAKLQTRSLWMSVSNLPKDRPPILGEADLALMQRHAIQTCDRLDGVSDGEIADPRRCVVDVKPLVCKGAAEAGQCLTPEQAALAEKLYAGPKTGPDDTLYPASPPGSEAGWARVVGRPWDLGVDQFRYYALGSDWDFRTLDLKRDAERFQAFDKGTNDAVATDISAFKKRGGKLIQYHGWADPLISPEGSIIYYEQVAAREGGIDRTDDFFRLFLIPAMGHCSGAYEVDWITPLENWVEKGEAPDLVRAARLPDPAEPARGVRPICAYPSVARYAGAGPTDALSSFACVEGPRGVRAGHAPKTPGEAPVPIARFAAR